MQTLVFILNLVGCFFLPSMGFASEGGTLTDLTHTGMGILSVIIFIGAYGLVIVEDKIHMRKSKPVMFAAGAIWIIYAIVMTGMGQTEVAHEAIKHNLLEYAELFLFLLAAMTYINAMEERNVFQALRSFLVSKGFSLRIVFWITGLLAFFISPIADNLTTALFMSAVAMAVGGTNRAFVIVACINIVVAANAGGAFSPFGDITTLMVWQKGKVDFIEFFDLFIPSVINWLVPAVLMSLSIVKEKPKTMGEEMIKMKFGARRIIILFILTIITAVSFHQYLHLPPATGMMFGLSYLGLFAYYIKIVEKEKYKNGINTLNGIDGPLGQIEEEFPRPHGTDVSHFDFMRKIARAEWDTLLFFYGVILCVGGLSQFGYLAMLSKVAYHDLGPTWANILVGILSAIVDNIPVMFAVLTMDPVMNHGQWLLVTLTAGVGGSLFSVGSAAGVALMGVARGTYTFGTHLKWTWAIALGYAASIYAHILINAKLFH